MAGGGAERGAVKLAEGLVRRGFDAKRKLLRDVSGGGAGAKRRDEKQRRNENEANQRLVHVRIPSILAGGRAVQIVERSTL